MTAAEQGSLCNPARDVQLEGSAAWSDCCFSHSLSLSLSLLGHLALRALLPSVINTEFMFQHLLIVLSVPPVISVCADDDDDVEGDDRQPPVSWSILTFLNNL